MPAVGRAFSFSFLFCPVLSPPPAAAVFGADCPPPADAIGGPASCAASIQHNAARAKSLPRKRTFPPLAENSEIFMDGELPLPRPVNEWFLPSASGKPERCPTALVRAN